MNKDSVGFKILANVKQANKEIKSLTYNLNGTANSTTKLGLSIKSAFNKSIIISFISCIKDLTETMINASEKQTEYIEDLNLLNNAFGDTADSAKELISYISQQTGWDTSTLTKTLANFRQLTTAVGKYSSETADTLSKNLLQFSMDISSLYNLSLDEATSKLNSAIAGQTRAIYSLGGDITVATMQEKALALGIDEEVSSMSRAEKEILIYLTLEEQLTNAQGDLSRTASSVSNQVKIFREQLKELGRLVGSLVLPVLKQLLPVLNGILMVINTILSELLTLFGLDANAWADEFGTGISTTFDDLTDSLLDADEASEKTKKSLRGFDKLNNITTPSSSSDDSSSSSGSSLGGINANLLTALGEYNSKLDTTVNKATEVRDKIMEWLGYTKLVNQETGNITWDLKEGDTNLEGIKTIAEIIGSGIIAKIAITWLPKILTGLGKAIAIIKSVFGGLGQLIGLNGFWSTLGTVLSDIGGFLSGSAVATFAVVTADVYVLWKAIEGSTESSVDKFSKISNVSEANYKRLQPIETAFDNIATTISSIDYSDLELTEEERTKIEQSIDDLTTTLKNQLADYVKTEEEDLWYLYKEAGVISEEEYKERIGDLENFKKEESDKIEEEGNDLKSSYQTIFDENGNIIASSYADWLDKLEGYENTSLEDLTMGEEDKAKIRANTENMSKNETIKYYSELLKQYKEDKDNAITKAEEKKNKTLEVAEELYGKNSEEYDKIKSKAEETYQSEVDTAKKKYDEIYDDFASTNSDIGEYIDKDTGDIKSNWEVFWNDIGGFIYNAIHNNWQKAWEELDKGINKINEWSDNVVKDTWNGLKSIGSGIGNGVKSLFGFAGGGFVDETVNSGELWVARENNSPEMVGTFGNHTAVANNDQIVSGITQGVMQGIKAVGGGNTNVTIEATGNADALMNFITFKQKQQNRQYGL